ncbi:GAK system XXXCH domain-containing protein [Desulfovulcanus sp.]
MVLKTLKKELSLVFNLIKKTAQEGRLPALEHVQKFNRLATRMHSLADDEWAEESEDFALLAKQLLQAVNQGNPQLAVLLVESISEARSFCHKFYR